MVIPFCVLSSSIKKKFREYSPICFCDGTLSIKDKTYHTRVILNIHFIQGMRFVSRVRLLTFVYGRRLRVTTVEGRVSNGD